MIAFLFPGQGSQHKGMGGALFHEISRFARVESEVDDILGYSLRELCLEDREGKLNRTEFTQPCLFVVNALHYYKAIESAKPVFLAGHSLGEYNALLAAGVFDFLTGLRIVKKRGELMGQLRDGGMAAVIGLDVARVAQIIEESGMATLDVANFNAPMQTVISGPVEDLKQAGPVFERAGATAFVPLPVSAAFHSRYVAEAAREFHAFLGGLSFKAPAIPVIANASARPYPIHEPAQTVPSLLTRQIAHSVQWLQSVRYLTLQGVDDFRELGPGSVLTKLLQQTHREAA